VLIFYSVINHNFSLKQFEQDRINYIGLILGAKDKKVLKSLEIPGFLKLDHQ